MINKLVMLGYKQINGYNRKVFVKIEYDTPEQHKRKNDKTLSMSGVIGAMKSGNCYGCAGQILDHILPLDKYNKKEGWNENTVGELLRVWRKYHLNNMNAGCIHQDRLNADKQVTLYDWSYGDTYRTVEKRVLNGDCKDMTEYERLTQRLRDTNGYVTSRVSAGGVGGVLVEEGYLVLKGTSQERAGFIKFLDHPDGLLGRVCTVCGYEYGSSWTYRAIPEGVMEYLYGLKETEFEYPWTR